MKPEELKYLLPDYIAGALPEAEMALVKRAIEQDAELMAEYQRLLPVIDLMQQARGLPQQAVGLNQILVNVNREIDRRNQRNLLNILPLRILAPTAGLVSIIVVFFLLISPRNEDILPGGTSSTIEETLVSTDPDPLAQMRIQAPDDIFLSDLSLENAVVVLSSDEETALIAAVHDQMFENIAYKEFLAASNEYLSTDEVLSTLTSQSASELLEELTDKTIL